MSEELQRCVVVNDGSHPAWTFWVRGQVLMVDCDDTGVAQNVGLGKPPKGIRIWEGTATPTGPIGYPVYTGKYRKLTDVEWARLKEGKAPWDDD